MKETRFNYSIRFEIPAIEYVNENNIINFTVIKNPIQKLAPIFIINTIINDKMYTKLMEKHTPASPLSLFLTINSVEDNIQCNLEQSLKPKVKYNYVENYELKIVKISLISNDVAPTGDDKLGFKLIQLILLDVKTYYFQFMNDISIKGTNTNIENIIKQYQQKMSEYDNSIYDVIEYNKTIFPQIYIKQDTNILEIPFVLQHMYKLTNNIPVFFFDSFSSLKIFDDIFVYKFYDLYKKEKLIKYDLSDYTVDNDIIKDEKFENQHLVKLLANPPKEVVLIKTDSDTEIVNVQNMLKVTTPQLYRLKMNLNTQAKEKSNTSRYIIHVPDSKSNAIERLKTLYDFHENIHSIKRIKITDFTPNLIDLGVLYKFTKYEDYQYTFLNLAYFYNKTGTGTYTCNMIGDMLVYA